VHALPSDGEGGARIDGALAALVGAEPARVERCAGDGALFGIIQGGLYESLRARVARRPRAAGFRRARDRGTVPSASRPRNGRAC
jgi:hypothetical protein